MIPHVDINIVKQNCPLMGLSRNVDPKLLLQKSCLGIIPDIGKSFWFIFKSYEPEEVSRPSEEMVMITLARLAENHLTWMSKAQSSPGALILRGFQSSLQIYCSKPVPVMKSELWFPEKQLCFYLLISYFFSRQATRQNACTLKNK